MLSAAKMFSRKSGFSQYKVYADAVFSHTKDSLQDMTNSLQNNGMKAGLRSRAISSEKTKATVVGEDQAQGRSQKSVLGRYKISILIVFHNM